MRICFDLFEMFFEVKKSSFSSRFFSQIAPLSSLEKAVDPGVFHSHIFRQTNQNSFLVTLKKNNLVIFDCLFRSICLTSSDMCHPHSFSQRKLSSKIPPNLSTVFLQQRRSLGQRHLSSKYRQIFLPYSCSNGRAWVKDIYPRKYCQIFLPYSCSNGGAWVKDIYPRKYRQIFTNLFF